MTGRVSAVSEPDGVGDGAADTALVALLAELERRGYDFVTPLNPTIRTVRGRREAARAGNLRDVFGWSLPFGPGTLDGEIEGLLAQAGVLVDAEGRRQSTVRVSRVEERLFLHSAYPARSGDAVFLGPDSYRFARFIRAELQAAPISARACDIGAGAGVGGIVAAASAPIGEVIFTDLNPAALRLARLNAAHAGVTARTHETAGLGQGLGDFDLVLANPPFIAGSGRLHSDGGDNLGTDVALAWSVEAMQRLAPGGRLLLYTGAPIVEGGDRLRDALQVAADAQGCDLRYGEIDPDIFGDELRRPAYGDVERIAAIGAVARRR